MALGRIAFLCGSMKIALTNLAYALLGWGLATVAYRAGQASR